MRRRVHRSFASLRMTVGEGLTERRWVRVKI